MSSGPRILIAGGENNVEPVQFGPQLKLQFPSISTLKTLLKRIYIFWNEGERAHTRDGHYAHACKAIWCAKCDDPSRIWSPPEWSTKISESLPHSCKEHRHRPLSHIFSFQKEKPSENSTNLTPRSIHRYMKRLFTYRVISTANPSQLLLTMLINVSTSNLQKIDKK